MSARTGDAEVFAVWDVLRSNARVVRRELCDQGIAPRAEIYLSEENLCERDAFGVELARHSWSRVRGAA